MTNMTLQQRAYNFLPDIHKTKKNQREFAVLDDVLFEPEQAEFVTGYIGTGDLLTDQDKARTPLLRSGDLARDKHQLTIGTVQVDPVTGAFSNGAFFADLVNQIGANGGITTDQNRLFGVPYYAYNLPIDLDKHVNFSRYFWTGAGTGNVNGEYVTKEPAGSLTVLHEVQGETVVPHTVLICVTYPTSPAVGDLIERADTPDRLIYRWSGTSWTVVSFWVEEAIEAIDFTQYAPGDFIYVCRTGPNYNRPLVHSFKAQAGRWVATPVVVSKTAPEFQRLGMLWEDTSVSPTRRFKRFDGFQWVPLTWSFAAGPSGIPADHTYVYDTRMLNGISDTWAVQNWWRHYEDLSATDRDAVATAGNSGQAVRPIVEFWSGIEAQPGSARVARNDQPQFAVYTVNPTSYQLEPRHVGSTIFEYQREHDAGTPDAVLGFIPVYSDTGEFMFELTLETQSIADAIGYRYFRDAQTGLCHGIWAKSDRLLTQAQDADGLYEVARALTSNPDHQVLTQVSRAKVLRHFTSVMASQTNFDGNALGLNNYRFSDRDPDLGALIIDPEAALLRVMATVQAAKLNVPDAIRRVSKEYNRVVFKFNNKLDQLWNNLTLCDATGTLRCTATQAVDIIMSSLFVGRSEDFPFHYSDMGTYVETRITGSTVSQIDATPKPIYIPASAPRIGAAPVYKPERFTERDGTQKLRGHDGSTVLARGDARDDIWLALETRFYNAVPAFRRADTARFSSADFDIRDFVGNLIPTPSAPAVDQIVNDYHAVSSPAANLKVASLQQSVYAIWDGTRWGTRQMLADDVFLNNADDQYYFFNGIAVVGIARYNRSFTFDYGINEFRQVVRREYERWAALKVVDAQSNTTFDTNDRFTWNYRSAGIEGHYQGIYYRLYGTVRPHSHPWEILGYTIEPTWWRTTYVPTSTAADGTPRYGSAHAMWTALGAGKVDASGTTIVTRVALTAPTPVDAAGNLRDPVALGIVDATMLDTTTLDDDWVYGDGAPVEQAFWESNHFSFASALAGFLMKPGVFCDSLWADWATNVADQGSFQVWRAPHLVHKELLNRPRVADLPVHLEVVNGVTQQRIGLNAWLSDVLQINGADPTTDFGAVMKRTIPALGYRAGGFLNKNRTVVETIAGKEIPFEDVHVLLHQAPVTTETFCSGVAVIREGTGFRIFGYDAHHPSFAVELGVAPTTGGQVELREEFTATRNQHVFTVASFGLPQGAADTARFAVLVDGQRLKDQFVRVTSATTFEIDSVVGVPEDSVVVATLLTAQSNPSTRVKTFMVSGHQFSYNASSSGVITTIEYGRYFAAPNEVIDFLIGYGRVLVQQGWVFESADATTGEISDWMLGARKFAAWCVRMADPRYVNQTNPVFYFSPIEAEATFRVDFGHILNVETVQNGAYGVLDQNGIPVAPENIAVSRIGGEIVATAQGKARIFGLRLLITEIQHAIFLPQVTKFNDLIFDPATALYHQTLKIDTYRTSNWNGRFEAPGFIISGDTLLPNFEKQAFDITRYYDVNNPPDDVTLRDQARNLFDYQHPQYMDDIDADDRAAFKYHRGTVATKGTRRPQVAFIRGTRLGNDNVFLTEDWAWALTSFGDTRLDLVQFRVFKDDFTNDRQVVSFNEPDILSDSIIQVTALHRTPSENHLRWLVGPKAADSGSANLRFPLDATGFPDTDNYRYSASIFDVDTKETLETLFHWDPRRNLFDPTAMAAIDLFSYYDPARYNAGVSLASQGVTLWGEAEVGTVWWDKTRARYFPYRFYTDPLVQAREWGKPKYFRASATFANGIVTVTTLDPITKQPKSHLFTTGMLVDLVDANETGYNGEDITVVVTSSTTFEYEITDNVDPVATGDLKVLDGKVTVYEWVRSPVPPDKYDAYVRTLSGVDALAGTARKDGDDYSYVVNQTKNSFGRTISNYYFWVRRNTRINPRHGISGDEIERRLADPSAVGLSWFAPGLETTMVVYTDQMKVPDNSAIEVIIDGRTLTTHQEWVLISENDPVNLPPSEIMNKMIDSMSGINAQGHTVPSSFLSVAEQIGNMNLPAQAVFTDVVAAQTLFNDTVNSIVKSIEFNTDSVLTQTFRLNHELSPTQPQGYWQRAEYRAPGYEAREVYDTVASLAERDLRLSLRYYTEGDLVRVEQGPNADLWSGASVASTYEWDGTAWNEIGIDNWTFTLNSNVALDATEFRQVWFGLLKLLDAGQQNQLAFALLREMLRQNKDCAWFFKTSYLNVQVFSDVDNSPFTRPNEIDAIIANIEATKPFRTKLRAQQVTYSLPAVEDFFTDMHEIPDMKVTMLFDRLSANTLDDGGYDGSGYGLREYDFPIWEYADMGREEWRVLGSLVCDGFTVVHAFGAPGGPKQYGYSYQIRHNGVPITADELLVTVTMTPMNAVLRVETSYALPAGYTIDVLQARGFVEGPAATLGDSVLGLYPSLLAYQSSYRHAVVRAMDNGAADPAAAIGYDTTMANAADGGAADERVRYSVQDSVLIAVTTGFTPNYAGYDAAPYDIAPYDQGFNDLGDHTFFVSVGQRPDIAPGNVVLPVYEDFTLGTSPYVTRSQITGYVDHVAWKNGGVWFLLQEGSDFTRLGLPHDETIMLSAARTVAGATLRIIYTRWRLERSLPDLTMVGPSWTAAHPWGVNFDISDALLDHRTLSLTLPNGVDLTNPPVGGTMTVNYTVTRKGNHPRGNLVRAAVVVEDILATHLQYDGALGIEDNRLAGIRYLNTTTKHIWHWSGSAWIDDGIVPTNQKVLVRRTGELWNYDGTNLTRVYSTGDVFAMPDVLTWPAFGAGVLDQTYTLGQSVNAATDYPEAYQIMQHSGTSR